MKTYQPPPCDAYRTCHQKTRLPVYFYDKTVGGVSLANVPCNITCAKNNPGGPCVTSHLTGEHYYVDSEKEFGKYANLTALDRNGRQKKYNYAQCAQYEKKHRVKNRAEMVIRLELESGGIQLSDSEERPNQGRARAPTDVSTRSAAPAVQPQPNRQVYQQVGEQYTPAPAVTPGRNVPTPPGQRTNNDQDQVLAQLTENCLRLAESHNEQRNVLNSFMGAMEPLAHQTVQNTSDIAALKSSDARTNQSLAELRERVEKLEGSSVGQTTSVVPPPPIQPLPEISADVDDVDMIPTQPFANIASAPNPADLSSVAFVKGQRVSYKHENGSTESATIVDVHNDPLNPNDPFYTLRMSNGHEKQTEKGRLVSITHTAPPISNAGFKTPQRTEEISFSIGVTDKKKVRTERRTYSERKLARKSALFGSRGGKISSRSRGKQPTIARAYGKQRSIARAYRAEKIGNLRALNAAVLLPSTPEQPSRSATPSKPAPVPSTFN